MNTAYMQELMRDKKQSHETLAQACGVDRTLITKILGGITNPSVKTLRGIARALDADIGKLINDGAS